MFWKKRRPTRTSRDTLVIAAYLDGVAPLISSKKKDPAARAGAQLFILGLVDMLRHVEKLSSEQFTATYRATLEQHGLLPEISIDEFVQLVGNCALNEQKVAQLIEEGAQSLKRFVARRDADAPFDLMRAGVFAESNGHTFAAISREASEHGFPPSSSPKEPRTSKNLQPNQDEADFEYWVVRQLSRANPPTKFLVIRPSEFARGLLTEIVVPKSLLLDKVGLVRSNTFGGSYDDKIAREVLFRWLSMPSSPSTEYVRVPDELVSACSLFLESLPKSAGVQIHCQECDKWWDSVLDLSVREGSSGARSKGTTRFTCPNRHLVFEKQYSLRFF